jgi:hypothetical protein
VSPRRHLAKESLPSVPDLALGKAYFKNKKNLCRVPDHGHSAKRVYIALVFPSFSLTLSQSCCRRRRSPPRPRPLAHAARAPTPSPRGRSRRSRDRAVRRALAVPPPCLPSLCPRRALTVPPPPRPATHRFVRDPSSRPLGMIRFNIVLIRLIFSFLVLNLCTCMIRLILSIDDCRPSCR